ncbi:MAG TPA: hypothetical protein VLG76_05400 [Rhabdochlamydiaceae bacterium]|nr:hypothetical protein [Rhabdochlamydiaceae bacterium]
MAGWLVISPFIFHYSREDHFFWTSDYTCAFLIAFFALLSFWEPLRKAHLLSLGVALWLVFAAYRSFPMLATAAEENSLAVGVSLLMFAIVPCHSHRLSPSWQEFEKSK